MRIAAVALLGACTFTPGEPKDPGAGGPTPPGGVDAPVAVQRPSCDLSDSSIRLCLDFESTPLGLDSSTGQHDASVTDVFATSRTPEQAVAVDTSSMIHVGETPALDLTDSITYEVWVYPVVYPPAGGRFVALDNTGQYTVYLQPDGKARCELANNHADTTSTIPLGTWTHLACTYDRQHIIAYVNGDQSSCNPSTTAIATTGVAGTTIGVPFIGAIDNVHVLSRAATASEVCVHAGRSDCSASACPGE